MMKYSPLFSENQLYACSKEGMWDPLAVLSCSHERKHRFNLVIYSLIVLIHIFTQDLDYDRKYDSSEENKDLIVILYYLLSQCIYHNICYICHIMYLSLGDNFGM